MRLTQFLGGDGGASDIGISRKKETSYHHGWSHKRTFAMYVWRGIKWQVSWDPPARDTKSDQKLDPSFPAAASTTVTCTKPIWTWPWYDMAMSMTLWPMAALAQTHQIRITHLFILHFWGEQLWFYDSHHLKVRRWQTLGISLHWPQLLLSKWKILEVWRLISTRVLPSAVTTWTRNGSQSWDGHLIICKLYK